jgi:oligopeptide transport system ATP-binding protein
MSAVPIPDPVVTRSRERLILEGDIPSPINPPSGCKFHTRCPYATERCKHETPVFKDYGGGHFAACHLLEK